MGCERESEDRSNRIRHASNFFHMGKGSCHVSKGKRIKLSSRTKRRFRLAPAVGRFSGQMDSESG
jgi:hypothetical protein